MDEQLRKFLSADKFPCLMAKSVMKKGLVSFHRASAEESAFDILDWFQDFLRDYHARPERLSSFMIALPSLSFSENERQLWRLLCDLRNADTHEADPRVSSDPANPRFSMSIGGEAFFILLCHPESPRFARRTPFPVIVFNPHQQFEDLRNRNLFFRVRDIIRKRDRILQGTPNPMLDDFGHSSEVFQYTGKIYDNGPDEMMKEFYDNHPTPERSWFSPEERSAAHHYRY